MLWLCYIRLKHFFSHFTDHLYWNDWAINCYSFYAGQCIKSIVMWLTILGPSIIPLLSMQVYEYCRHCWCIEWPFLESAVHGVPADTPPACRIVFCHCLSYWGLVELCLPTWCSHLCHIFTHMLSQFISLTGKITGHLNFLSEQIKLAVLSKLEWIYCAWNLFAFRVSG